MKLLAIDTCADQCAACVLDTHEDTVHAAVREMSKGHAETLMDVIADCMAAGKSGFDDLDRIAVTVGPGSFTGVRVGVATARGLALALAVPAVAVTTLAALADAARARYPGRPVLAANDARRDEIYAALYDSAGHEIAAPHVTTLSATASQVTPETVLTGSAAPHLAAMGAAAFAVAGETAGPPIDVVARLGARDPGAGPAPRPLYLRAPDAKPQAGFALPRRDG